MKIATFLKYGGIAALFLIGMVVATGIVFRVGFLVLEGGSRFTNDTDARVEFLLFTYDNYERDRGIISRHSIGPRDTKFVWEPYPVCIQVVGSDKSVQATGNFSDEEPHITLTEALAGAACPLDIQVWEKGDRWTCPASKAGYEPCVRIE